jgi:dienelactone hydrolase
VPSRWPPYDAGVAEILLFHHAQGLTPGCLSFADELRASRHLVHVPDLYDGRVFDELAQGVRYAEDELGFDAFIERGRAVAEELAGELVYAGFSLGVLPAQMLAQTRAGTRGALLFHSAVPPSEFGGEWPANVPLQIHMMDRDPFALEGDLDVARELAASQPRAELFEYAGDKHLFLDRSVADYDEAAAALVSQRVLSWLESVA